MGRPRKPTVLKIVAGTDRACRKPANEPKPREVKAPAAPEHLSEQAGICWRKLSPLLHRMGVLSVADLLALERCCETYSEIRHLQLEIGLLGATTYETKSAKDGFMRRAHPEVAQLADADRRFKGYLSEFGLTPAARSRLSVDKGQPAGDTLAKYFG